MADEHVTIASTASPSPVAAPSQAAPAATATVAPQRLYDPATVAPGAVQSGDALNWTPQQVAAHKEMQDLRAQMFGEGGVLKPEVRAKFSEIREWLYGGGPVPKHIQPAKAEAANSLPDPSGFKSEDFAHTNEPATGPQDYRLQHGAKLPADIPLADGKGLEADLRQWAFDLKLPPGFGSDVIERVLHHSNQARALGLTDAEGAISTFHSGESAAALAMEADRLLAPIGGLEKAQQVAQAYLDATLTKQQIADLQQTLVKPDGRMSSVLFDPVILYRLVSLARARGIVKG